MIFKVLFPVFPSMESMFNFRSNKNTPPVSHVLVPASSFFAHEVPLAVRIHFRIMYLLNSDVRNTNASF